MNYWFLANTKSYPAQLLLLSNQLFYHISISSDYIDLLNTSWNCEIHLSTHKNGKEIFWQPTIFPLFVSWIRVNPSPTQNFIDLGLEKKKWIVSFHIYWIALTKADRKRVPWNFDEIGRMTLGPFFLCAHAFMGRIFFLFLKEFFEIF